MPHRRAVPSCRSVHSRLPVAEASGASDNGRASRALIQTVIRCVTTGCLDLSQLDPLLLFIPLGLVSEHLGPAFTVPPLMAFTIRDSLSPDWLTFSVSISARPVDLSPDPLPVRVLRPADPGARRLSTR